MNSNAAPVPVWTIANPALLSLTGEVTNSMDTVIMSTGSDLYTATGQDSVLNLAQGWNVAEFNIFGDCCFSEANFNGGATVVVKTSVSNGTTDQPSCAAEGFTGETNNLILVSPCSASEGASPAIVFTEKSSGGITPPPHQLALEPWLILLI
jgi:hypothetical protein